MPHRDPKIGLTNFNHMEAYERGYTVARYGGFHWISSAIPCYEENPYPIVSPEFLDYDEGYAQGFEDLANDCGMAQRFR